MMRLSFLSTTAALFIGSAAWAADFAIPVDGDFWVDDITWPTQGKGYEFRWLVIEHDGQLAVCGAGKYVNVSNKTQTRDLMRKAKVTLDGKPILKDLTFFTQLKSNADLATAKATCRDTGAKAGKNSKVGLDISGRARF
ncbi:hypothetical protein OU426_03735 [Frigidibacter sp. RF13]|uniref:hypothetical protein n=1 Tax=Frigidibacter sp. RF13 TaxID=2997340 RepID=UPI002271552F|nr:hypothetical protein [Frigidibacter sp. RF13]MCY1125956.1 hypothetical protein [Frigidibacter sp. RF13]